MCEVTDNIFFKLATSSCQLLMYMFVFILLVEFLFVVVVVVSNFSIFDMNILQNILVALLGQSFITKEGNRCSILNNVVT